MTMAIEMAYAVQLPGCEQKDRLPYRVPNDEDERILMNSSAFKWVEDYVQSLELVLKEELEAVPGVKKMLELQVINMMTTAHRHETGTGNKKRRGLLSFWPFNQ